MEDTSHQTAMIGMSHRKLDFTLEYRNA